MDLTERHDLRSGDPPWPAPDTTPSDPLPDRHVDVAICGAGIMGAMLAERLCAAGLRVAIVDRRAPAAGSTSASTALVLWEADIPLISLAARIGESEAARRWCRVIAAVRSLKTRIDDEGFDADRIDRSSLYIAGDLLDAQGLEAEARLRSRFGMLSLYRDAGSVEQRFRIAPVAAIESADSFEVDPVKLTLSLLARARAGGATVSFPVDAMRFEHHPNGIDMITDKGIVRAAHAVIAGGYERARAYLPGSFSLSSSYAIASGPGECAWADNALIWQASESYIYARADVHGRIIAGGGDEPFTHARHRDRLIPEKAAAIATDLHALLGKPVRPRERWAAMFGKSPDGLPAIGRAANSERLWLASGFGGNGVSFAALAAEIITGALTGAPDPDADCFDPYRFEA